MSYSPVKCVPVGRGRRPDLAYQYVREPLLGDEYGQLCNACATPLERRCVWALGDTGLRVSELCGLMP